MKKWPRCMQHVSGPMKRALVVFKCLVSSPFLLWCTKNHANLTFLSLPLLTANIENRLEDLFEKIAKMPEEELAEAEARKDKQRKLRLREEKLEQQRLSQEERVRRALERAQAAPKRQTGKKLVYRSAPPKRRGAGDAAAKVVQSKEEAEYRLFFTDS